MCDKVITGIGVACTICLVVLGFWVFSLNSEIYTKLSDCTESTEGTLQEVTVVNELYTGTYSYVVNGNDYTVLADTGYSSSDGVEDSITVYYDKSNAQYSYCNNSNSPDRLKFNMFFTIAITVVATLFLLLSIVKY